MVLFASIAVAAVSLLGLTLATPVPPFPMAKTLSKNSFRVERVQYGTTSKTAAKSMIKVFNKFGFEMPVSLAKLHQPKAAAATAANNTAQTGSVTNTPETNDVEFLSPITVGGQTMMMDFDTGSSDLWLFSTALPAADQVGHTVFNPAKSSTFKQEQGASFMISFGDGSASEGNVVGTDTVNIGGATATKQVVELATSVSASFVQDTQSNGLVGLAFSTLNTVQPNQARTFLDTIKNDLALPVLTADLKHNTTGAYEFGKINSAAFKGQLSFTDVNSTSGFWQVQSSSFAIGSGQVQANTVNSPAIADTGTTLLLVDDNVAAAYYATISGAAFDENQSMFTFPCDAQLQDLSVALGPTYMAVIDKSLILFENQGANTCVGSVQGNQGSGLQIYGDILFKSQFTVFNIGNSTIGFAPHT